MWIRGRQGKIRLGLLSPVVNYFSLSKDFHRCNMGTLRLRVSLKVPGKILSDWESVEWALGHGGRAQECGNPVGVNQPIALWEAPSLHHKGLCVIIFAGEIFAVR